MHNLLCVLLSPCFRPSCCCFSSGDSNAQQQQQLRIDLAQLEAEVEDLQAEQQCALRDKDVVEQQYLEQIIAVSVWACVYANNHAYVCVCLVTVCSALRVE